MDPVTVTVSGGASVLLLERGIALFKSVRSLTHPRSGDVAAQLAKGVNEDVRDALTVQQLNFDKALLELRNDLRDMTDEARKELMQALRDLRP